jgi:hypothetical protein
MAAADAPQGAAPVAGATGAGATGAGASAARATGTGAAGTDATGAKASVAKASVADASGAGAIVANASAESATDAGATGAGAESAAGGLARPAQGPATPPLLCLGTAPRFVLAVRPDGARGATATFDYLGDGSFSFAPPPRPGLVASRHALATAGGPLPVALEARACPALGVDFPITLRIEIQAGGGTTTFLGCCLWQDG